MIGPNTTLEAVTVGGHQGYWISGPLNEFFFVDANGSFRSETVRLAANTLILDYNGTVIRIEGNLTKAQALEIAASLAYSPSPPGPGAGRGGCRGRSPTGRCL